MQKKLISNGVVENEEISHENVQFEKAEKHLGSQAEFKVGKEVSWMKVVGNDQYMDIPIRPGKEASRDL